MHKKQQYIILSVVIIALTLLVIVFILLRNSATTSEIQPLSTAIVDIDDRTLQENIISGVVRAITWLDDRYFVYTKNIDNSVAYGDKENVFIYDTLAQTSTAIPDVTLYDWQDAGSVFFGCRNYNLSASLTCMRKMNITTFMSYPLMVTLEKLHRCLIT